MEEETALADVGNNGIERQPVKSAPNLFALGEGDEEEEADILQSPPAVKFALEEAAVVAPPPPPYGDVQQEQRQQQQQQPSAELLLGTEDFLDPSPSTSSTKRTSTGKKSGWI